MNKTDFNKITTVVKTYISELNNIAMICTKDNIITLEHLTVNQLTELSDKARDLQSKTDQFLKQDLYHVIGMGNLSGAQMAIVAKLVKDTTEHRSLMKTLATLPTLPKKVVCKSTYKSKTLNCTLVK
jgi:hypothetical protein